MDIDDLDREIACIGDTLKSLTHAQHELKDSAGSYSVPVTLMRSTFRLGVHGFGSNDTITLSSTKAIIAAQPDGCDFLVGSECGEDYAVVWPHGVSPIKKVANTMAAALAIAVISWKKGDLIKRRDALIEERKAILQVIADAAAKRRKAAQSALGAAQLWLCGCVTIWLWAMVWRAL